MTPLEKFYEYKCVGGSHGMAPYARDLRSLASDMTTIGEVGIRFGYSSVPFLLGLQDQKRWRDSLKPCNLYSCDIEHLPQHDELAKHCPEGLWTRSYCDSVTWDMPKVDLLLIDGHHTYQQVKRELVHLEPRVDRYLLFHDSIHFGTVGGGLKHQTKGHSQGIRLAIDELMIAKPEWRLHAHLADGPGVLILRKHT